MKTQAAVLVAPDHPLEIADLDVPRLGPGQALVEIAYSGVCGTQLLERRGLKGPDPWLPHCLGHEGTGTVLEAGPSVTKVRPGDKVVLSWIRGDGIEAGGAVYGWGGRTVNAGGVTTFQRHAVVSENRLTPAPDRLPLDLATLLGCAAPTGMGAVLNVLRARPGDSIVVFGLGGVGLHAVLAAVLWGCAPVIGVDPAEARRALALACGADRAVDPTTEDAAEAARSLSPRGVDLAVEATGAPAAVQQALALVRPRGGRAVAIGNAPHGAALTLDPAAFNAGKSLLGTWGGDSFPDRDFPRYAKLLAADDRLVRSVLAAPCALAQADRALDDLAAGRVGRPLIDMRI